MQIIQKVSIFVVLFLFAFSACNQQQGKSAKPQGETKKQAAVKTAEPTDSKSPAKKKAPLSAEAKKLKEFCDNHLAEAGKLVKKLETAKGKQKPLASLSDYNDLTNHLYNADGRAGVFSNMHPDKSVREAAEECERQVNAFQTETSLNRKVFETFAAIKADKTFDSADKRMLERILRDFRRAGVDKDEATRKKISEMTKEEMKFKQEYYRLGREDTKSVKLNPKQLEGLPDDYLENHKPGKDGKVEITTSFPEYFPFMKYAKDFDAKKKLYEAQMTIAYPDNNKNLLKVLEIRKKLAELKGYKNHAEFATETMMIKNPQAVDKFIAKITKAAKVAGERDYKVLLARKQKDDPKATAVQPWEKYYLIEVVKKEQFKVDPKDARPYLDVRKVQRGLFDVIENMYGVKIVKSEGDPLIWHKSVQAFDLMENGKKIAHFYLDIYPRKDKVKSAAMYPMAGGMKDKQMPQATLMANFPEPEGDKQALMEMMDVETFFHESGHMMHHLLGGVERKYVEFSGTATEWDFIEVPSQLFEEWVWQPKLIAKFAKNEKGEAIPEELVLKMKKAEDFGKGLWVSGQMFYAALSLNMYTQDLSKKTPEALVKELYTKYMPYKFYDWMHYETNFWHLMGYSSNYYTYMWSLVIAKDLQLAFEKTGYVDKKLCAKYRKTVIAPGGSKDAALLVKDFLGRNFKYDAFFDWLKKSS